MVKLDEGFDTPMPTLLPVIELFPLEYNCPKLLKLKPRSTRERERERI